MNLSEGMLFQVCLTMLIVGAVAGSWISLSVRGLLVPRVLHTTPVLVQHASVDPVLDHIELRIVVDGTPKAFKLTPQMVSSLVREFDRATEILDERCPRPRLVVTRR